MKCVILAGGRGTRLGSESDLRPKPMTEIGGRPILWHIMKLYEAHGVEDFVICLGHRGYVIKEYFHNYFLHNADSIVDLGANTVEYVRSGCERWRVALIDTGLDTMTGGRLKRVAGLLEDEESFCFTYGDGVGDVDIGSSIAFHEAHGRMATMTVVHSPIRFGSAMTDGDRVIEFAEKTNLGGDRINGGFFVLSRKVLDLIESDGISWEREPLEALATRDELRAWRHDGFWKPMDTLRERDELEALWRSGAPPWKVWA